MSERDIFLDALDRTDPAARAAYLDAACGDAEQRRRVEALLAAHEAAGRFLATPVPAPADDAATVAATATGGEAPRPAVGPTTAPDPGATADHTPTPHANGPVGARPVDEGPGAVVGPYTLLQVIGEGGMGTVYMAHQEQPVRRRVALKVIKPGMDSRQVIARFEAERQALAIMDHPNIAKVLDAGTTDSGRPYFVMELVQGLPITQYCDDTRLDPRARLELMVPVCQAVQHAHQKGVIHRDIKPSNVLVTEVDGRPVPKVIDFGIAKAIDQSLTEQTLFTQFGAIVGTPEYMSPEQAGLGSMDVDTRSDVYSLGVLLYELLTGTTPLERGRLRQAGFAEILRRIREEEPPTPSSRLSASREALPSLSAVRRTEPARLSRLVRGELDWIVMKALEKDRSRRYDTANALARDLQRHLADEPVEAGPPSRSYRLRKFARKHRAAFGTAAAFAALLLVAATVSTVLAIRAIWAEAQAERQRRLAETAEGQARAERNAAVAARDAESAERRRAESAEESAHRELEKSRLVTDFLTQDLLTQAEPGNNAVEDRVTLLEVVDRAAAKVGERYGGRPDLEEELRRVFARIYHGLASWQKAEAQWRAVLESAERRLGPESAEAALATAELGHILYHRGRLDEAIDLMEPAIRRLSRTRGPQHLTTLLSRNNLTTAYLEAGRLAEATAMAEESLPLMTATLGPQHQVTLTARNNLASAHASAGRLAEAITTHEETLRLRAAALGPEHPDTLISRSNLASAYASAGRLAEAITTHEETLRLMSAALGPEHPETLIVRSTLAAAYGAAGRPAKAIAIHREIARLAESAFGPDAISTIDSWHSLAHSLEGSMPAEAEALFGRALEGYRRLQGPDGPMARKLAIDLAALLAQTGRADEALRILDRIRMAGPVDSMLLPRLHVLAHSLELRHPSEAETLFRWALKGARQHQGPDSPFTLKLTGDLTNLLGRMGRHGEAKPILRDALDRVRSHHGPEDPQTAGGLASLGLSLVQQQMWAEAEPILRECLAIRERHEPNVWTTFNTRSMLGGALLGLGRSDEAEPPLVSGLEGLIAREASIPPPGKVRIPEAAERLARLYEATGRRDEAARLREQYDLGPAEELPDLPDDPFASAPADAGGADAP